MHTTEIPSTGFHRLAERLVFGARPLVLAVFVLLTAVALWFAVQLEVDAGFKKQIPLGHGYMQTYLDYEVEFGGANRVLVAVVARDGNMFTLPFMQTMEKITNDVIAIDAVDNARVRSIFTPNVRFVEVVEDGFAGGNVIPATFAPNAPGFEAQPQDFQDIRDNIVKAGIVGRLVAKDFSGAMVWADLVPEGVGNDRLDYQQVAAELEEIRQRYEDEDTSVHVIGFAKAVGDIADGARSVIWFFFITIGFTWLLLFLYSTSVKLASLTVLCALVSVVWMLGALRLMGFGIDPMNMLTPFLIFAIAVSHGEQMINRFRGQIFFGGLEEGTVEELRARAAHAVDPLTAARRSFRALLVPGTVALIAGCVGFAAILIIPIRIIFELAITATVGVALTIFTDLILLPVLLSYTRLRNLPRKREYRLRQLTRFDRVWALLSHLSRPWAAALVILIGLVAWFFAEQHGDRVMVGDAEEGVAELHADARYNQDSRVITEKFALGVDILNVIAEAAPAACTQSWQAMETIDRFSWYMSNVEGVQQVMSLPMAAKIVNAGWNEGSLRWRVLPRDKDTLRVATQGFETDSGLLNTDCSAIPVMIFLTDHRATTIDRVVDAVKTFRASDGANVQALRTLLAVEEGEPLPDPDRTNVREAHIEAAEAAQAAGEEYQGDAVNLRIGTGNVGVAAATNDEVRKVETRMLLLLYAAVFLMCLVSFRNPLAALCIVLPLVLVTELGHSLMVELDIGMKVNTLTVVALGVGIGVDYAIYIFARMREAMQQGCTLSESYFIALKTTGIAIFYTALTLAVGVAMWIWSDLKFQADMGVMLTFMFLVNMIAAIIFLPALCRWLLRPREKDSWKPAV